MLRNVIFLGFCFVLASAGGNFDDLMRSIQAITERSDFDRLNDDEIIFQIKSILNDQGFVSDRLMADLDFFSGIAGLFKGNDAKRWSTVNFATQTACYQGKSGSLLSEAIFAYSTFVGYGCYCGGGIYNGNYLDATDLCCKHHDECYNRVSKLYGLSHGCHTYTTAYSMTCCKHSKITKCTDTGPSAGRALCECDQEAARCLAGSSAKRSYNKAYMNNRSQCHDIPGRDTKVLSAWDILKTCKHAFQTVKTFPQTIRSQGRCPVEKKVSSWMWGDNQKYAEEETEKFEEEFE